MPKPASSGFDEFFGSEGLGDGGKAIGYEEFILGWLRLGSLEIAEVTLK